MKLDHGRSSKHLYKVVSPSSLSCRKGGRVFTFIKQIKQPDPVHFVKEKEMYIYVCLTGYIFTYKCFNSLSISFFM